MHGLDMAYDAWSKEMREAHLARRRQVKGELSLRSASLTRADQGSLERGKPGWTSRIAAMLPTLRRLLVGTA